MKILSGHQSNYLPYPGLFYKIAKSDGFIFVDHVQFDRKSWQNRNRIKGPQGWIYLTVPTIKKGKLEQSILEVTFDETNSWRKKHWDSIKFNYQRAPYFKEVAGFLEEFYQSASPFLYEWNRSFTIHILKLLKVTTPVYFSEDYVFEGKKTEMLTSMCEVLKFDGYLSNEGSRAYVDEAVFAEKNLTHQFCNYTTPVYPQMYDGFEPNLSIIDMLANVGIESTRKLIL